MECNYSQGILKQLDVSDIQLDCNNPRISMVLEAYGPNPTPEQIGMALSESTDRTESGTTIEVLKESIRSNGGISQPIIVNHVDGKYIVIEGNTRLQIYKDFQERGVKGNWTQIFAIVHEHMSDEHMHAIRLQSHIVGPRPWNPYSKAKYLKKLRDEEELSTTRIVELCGGNKSEILEFINALEDMQKYYQNVVDEQDFDVRQFSAFREMTKSKKCIAALAANGFDKKDFGRWIIDGKIGEASNVRRLADVLNNDKTRDIFLKDGLKKAISNLENPLSESTKHAGIGDLADVLSQKIAEISWDEVLEMKEGKREKEVDSLNYLFDKMEAFLKVLK